MRRVTDHEAIWKAQQLAQRRLTPEQRLRQNDSLTRLTREAKRSRGERSRGDFGRSSELEALDTEGLFAALDAQGVEFVLVGGVAALVHGSSRPTADIDLLPRPAPENLDRMVLALDDLEAAVHIPADRVPMQPGDLWEFETSHREPAAFQEAEAWSFPTTAGPVDVVISTAAARGYEAQRKRAEAHALFGITVFVAGIDDLIASKEALGRSKDLPVIEELRQIRGDHDR
ncbi:MAG: hypothetical protein HYU28_04700 [Actinobacteria bacterium]|nr:hypothetical protein [Actinomycetota bacterium]